MMKMTQSNIISSSSEVNYFAQCLLTPCQTTGSKGRRLLTVLIASVSGFSACMLPIFYKGVVVFHIFGLAVLLSVLMLMYFLLLFGLVKVENENHLCTGFIHS